MCLEAVLHKPQIKINTVTLVFLHANTSHKVLEPEESQILSKREYSGLQKHLDVFLD